MMVALASCTANATPRALSGERGEGPAASACPEGDGCGEQAE